MTDELGVFLVEDNPGDARLIEEMLQDVDDILRRVIPEDSMASTQHIHHEQRLSTALESLDETDVHVILLDLNLPDSTGLDTLKTVIDATEIVPIIVLTGLKDRDLGIQAIQLGAQDYLVKGEVTADILLRAIHHAIERTRQERARKRQREQLASLNRLNRIVQDITHSVITTSTREALECDVCKRLVESDSYCFAWIGEVNRGTAAITSRVAAGTENGYLDEIEITVGDSDTAKGPTGTALRTSEVQIVENIETAPADEAWREESLERGYRSTAAVPVVHEELLYGVLNIYAVSPDAFGESEVEILSRLGAVIGHAINAIERKDALVSETVLELEFQVEGMAEELVTLSKKRQCTIEFEKLIHNESVLIVYGRAENVKRNELQSAIAEIDAIDEFRFLTAEDDIEFELVTSIGSSLTEELAVHGGRITAVRLHDGQLRFVVEFPSGRDKRQLIALVDEQCPGATNIAQRTVDRNSRDRPAYHSIVQTQLTEKQQTALETAYSAGLYEWPRKTTNQEVAERLGVSTATFTEHLRGAEREFFHAVFESEQSGEESISVKHD